MFKIEDEPHAELLRGEYATRADALDHLHALALLPWDAPPHQAPCASWRTCGRVYEIVEYDATASPWTELRREPALQIDASGARWLCVRPM